MKVTTTTGAPRLGVEQVLEHREAPALQRAQHDAHVLAHAQLLARDAVVLVAAWRALRMSSQASRRSIAGDVRQARRADSLDRDLGAQEVAAEQRQRVEPGRGELHLLVLEQAAHQLGARVVGLLAVGALARRQQHARLDLDQHRRHQQVVAGELEVARADLLDVGQVLPRHARQRDVEDVEVLPPDQVEQQVERALEGLEEDLERIGRDVEVVRQRRTAARRTGAPRAMLSTDLAFARPRRALRRVGVSHGVARSALPGLVDVGLLRHPRLVVLGLGARGRCGGPTSSARPLRAARPRASASSPSARR